MSVKITEMRGDEEVFHVVDMDARGDISIAYIKAGEYYNSIIQYKGQPIGEVWMGISMTDIRQKTYAYLVNLENAIESWRNT